MSDADFIPAKSKKSTGKPQALECRYCKEVGHKLAECPKIVCKRCNRRGHIEQNCTVKICDFCNKQGHTRQDCYSLTCRKCGSTEHATQDCTVHKKKIVDTDNEYNICRCCGEYGHYYCV